MSFGLSPSDLVNGIKLALELNNAFFVRLNRAELRYLEFGDEIKSLERCLGRLAEVFETASREREERVFPLDYKTLDSNVDRERKELVGDFEKTLLRCRELLSENAKFLTKSAGGVWDNAKWHFATQNTVDLLRSRLQSHTAKALLVIQPLQFQLLHEISSNVWDIRHDVRALRNEIRLFAARDQHISQDPAALPQVPSDLDHLFVEAIQVRAPNTYSGISAFPLREGLDALIYHFRESTVKFADGEFSGSASPTVEQLLNLAKALWILEKLKASSSLDKAGTQSLWARSIYICETKILEQFRRPAIGSDIFIRESQNISQLNRENFTIWILQEPLEAPRTITDEDSGEEKILQVSLQKSHGVSKKTLTVFRQAMNEFRLVRVAVPEAEGYASLPEERIINVHAFRISPHYGLPTVLPSTSLHVSGNYVHRGDFYDFLALEDLFAFQHALTGYKVVHSSSSIGWTTCHSGFFRTHQESGNGNLQLWKSTPMQRLVSEDCISSGAQALVNTKSIPNSGSFTTAPTTVEAIVHQVGGGVASINSGSSDGVQVISGSKPRDPVLVVFTRFRGRLAFLHLQIDNQIQMRREPCQCTESGHTCCEVVISRPKRKKFRIRAHPAETDKEGNDILPSWNLSVLGLPRHPDFAKLEKLDDVIWLNLHFSSVESREAFEIAFQTASNFRDYEQEGFRKLSIAIDWRSQKQSSELRDRAPQ